MTAAHDYGRLEIREVKKMFVNTQEFSQIRIKFFYDTLDESDPLSKRCTIKTTCKIFKEPDGDMLAVGYSGCYIGDQFSKRFGRKLALKRAMDKFSRPTRTEIWNDVKLKMHLAAKAPHKG